MSRVSGTPPGAAYICPETRPEGHQYHPSGPAIAAPARNRTARVAAERNTRSDSPGCGEPSGYHEVDRLVAGVDFGAEGPVSVARATERLTRNVALARHALASAGAEYIFALQPTMAISQKVLTPREQDVAARVSSADWFKQMSSFYQEFRNSLRALEQPGFRFIDTTSVFDGCGDDIDVTSRVPRNKKPRRLREARRRGRNREEAARTPVGMIEYEAATVCE